MQEIESPDFRSVDAVISEIDHSTRLCVKSDLRSNQERRREGVRGRSWESLQLPFLTPQTPLTSHFTVILSFYVAVSS